MRDDLVYWHNKVDVFIEKSYEVYVGRPVAPMLHEFSLVLAKLKLI